MRLVQSTYTLSAHGNMGTDEDRHVDIHIGPDWVDPQWVTVSAVLSPLSNLDAIEAQHGEGYRLGGIPERMDATGKSLGPVVEYEVETQTDPNGDDARVLVFDLNNNPHADWMMALTVDYDPPAEFGMVVYPEVQP